MGGPPFTTKRKDVGATIIKFYMIGWMFISNLWSIEYGYLIIFALMYITGLGEVVDFKRNILWLKVAKTGKPTVLVVVAFGSHSLGDS